LSSAGTGETVNSGVVVLLISFAAALPFLSFLARYEVFGL
jgi:hypothetical protein